MQKIQVAICSVTLAPIRVILLLLSMAFLWPIGTILTYNYTEQEKSIPLTGYRKSFLPIARFFSRCVFWSAGYQWITITGQIDPKARILIFAPHSGFFDSMLVTYLNFVSVVGRKGTEDLPLFGNLTNLTQPIIVDREHKESRNKSFDQIIDRVNSPLAWPHLSMFSEGTCTNGQVLVKFKTGAFRPGKPVQPVCFVYNHQIMDTATWSWDGPHYMLLIWLGLCQIHSPVEFIFMPTYYPSQQEIEDPELYAENVRSIMAERMDIPLSDYSYEDARVVHKCMMYGLPSSSGLIQIHSLKRVVNTTVDEIYDLIPKFAQLADKLTGLCHMEKFADNLGLTMNKNVTNLFQMFDTENQGNFLLQDFIRVHFLVINKIDRQKSIDTVFAGLDCFISGKCLVGDFRVDVKRKFGIEFCVDFELLVEDDGKIIEKVFREFLEKQTLVLYLFAVVAKK